MAVSLGETAMPAGATPICVARRADPSAPEALRLIRQLWEDVEPHLRRLTIPKLSDSRSRSPHH
jgi:hypothetical protein